MGEAMSQALGHDPGYFADLYGENRRESIAYALESSPAAVAICDMVDKHTGVSDIVFHGTTKKLFDTLSDKHKATSDNWPRSARGLAEVIKRQTRALKSLDIEVIQSGKVERIGTDRGLPITINKLQKTKPTFDGDKGVI